MARSALIEGVAQLGRALGQIATMPTTPTLRREEIKLQVASASALIHVKGYTSPETIAAFERADALIESFVCSDNMLCSLTFQTRLNSSEVRRCARRTECGGECAIRQSPVAADVRDGYGASMLFRFAESVVNIAHMGKVK